MKKVAVVLLVLLAAAGAVIWLGRERRPVLVLTAPFVDTGHVAVRVNRLELAYELPGGLRGRPPQWIMGHSWLENAWVTLNRTTQQVPFDGLVWVVVEATVASDQPLKQEEIDYRLDYGTYTIGGVRERRFLEETGRPYTIGTRFEVTDGPLPKALEIQVKGEWLRFPIDVR